MATETLYVNNLGDECLILNQVGAACPNHYENVDESPGHNGDTDYNVAGANDTWQRDLYNLFNSGVGAGVINSVRVYCVMKVQTLTASYGQCSIKSGGVADNSASKGLTTTWVTHSNVWAVPPEGGAWTWAKINLLQAGARLYGNSTKGQPIAAVTQVYVVVDYDPYVPPVLGGRSAAIGAKMIGEGLI